MSRIAIVKNDIILLSFNFIRAMIEAKQASFHDGLYILRFSGPLADFSPDTLGYGLGAPEKENLRTCVQSTVAGLPIF